MTESVLLGLLAVLVLVLGALVAGLVVAWRRTRDEVRQAQQESRALAASLEALEARLPADVPGDDAGRHPHGARHDQQPRHEYVITGLAPQGGETDRPGPAEASHASAVTGEERPGSAPPPGRIDGRLFVDIVARETCAKALGLAGGLRRGLSPENRDLIRGAVRRETKRARKQRRAEERQALRELRARQRAEGAEGAEGGEAA